MSEQGAGEVRIALSAKGKIHNRSKLHPQPPLDIAFMSFSMHASAAYSLRQAGFAFKNARIQTAKVGAGRNATVDDDAKARRDSRARKRGISGSDDDAA